MSQWWIHALTWGSAAALVSGAVLVAALFVAPYAFLHDYPDDVQEAAREPSLAEKRLGLAAGLVFFLTLLATLFAVAATWGAQHPDASYLSLAAMALVGMVLFSVVDTVIVDWVVVNRLRPARVILPGTEHCAGWRDDAFHVKGVLAPKAVAAQVALSGAIAGVAFLIT